MSLPTTYELAHLAALLMVSDSQIAHEKNDVAIRYAIDLWDAAEDYIDARRFDMIREHADEPHENEAP